ncbi:hypothetical protein [Pseudoxanthomonas sp. USHLN014]|uniref:hypothetical protein n=1 Tax=Pseudoxanthomonas sp. USHLN014 TaxID=3081297 RepID=UPI00301D780B
MMSLVALSPAMRYLLAGLAGAVLLLGLLLGISLAANAWLIWRLGGAKAACTASQQSAVTAALEAERKRADQADRTAAGIAQDTRTERANAVIGAQGDTHARDTQIRTVVVHDDCRMPDGLPDLRPAVDAANAAAR